MLGLVDKKNKYNIASQINVSHIEENLDKQTGFKSYVHFQKIQGNFRFYLGNNIENDKYDPNDMGFLYDNNEINNLLGDIALCVEVSQKEAEKQEKNLKDHLAHLFVHGTLHLMGFDHKKKSERNKMETIEKRVLIKLGIDDPYS